MGTDYFIACRPKEELFELFRGAEWNRLRGLLFTPPKKEVFAQGVLDLMMDHLDEGLEEYALAVGRTIWDWCDARDWQVELVHDACTEEPDWWGWKTTGSRDETEPEVAAQMSDSQRQEREAMFDDRTALLRVISDLRLYRAAARRFLGQFEEATIAIKQFEEAAAWRLLEQFEEATAAVKQFEETVTAIEAGESPPVR